MSGFAARKLRLALGLSLPLLSALPALGQTTGAIAGRVADSTGAPLAGATVEATSPSLQGSRTSTTGADGAFRFAGLPPGIYRVHAILPGFAEAEMTATVSLNATAAVELVLRIVAQESVTVGADAPIIDPTSTAAGTHYDAGVVAQLPVQRNYADVVKANPGVATDRGDTQGGRSLVLSIYGATSAENQWMVDGVNTTSVYRGTQGKALTAEFIQEVQVSTGGYSAEYGRALGGVVSVVTKSGGNQFHGEGFVYYDSYGTTAARVFGPEDSAIAEMRVVAGGHYDAGADLGGYVVKDRLWFFGAYDRVRLDAKVSRFTASNDDVTPEDRFPLASTDDLYSGKLTWRPAAGTTLVGTVFSDHSGSAGAAGADPRQSVGSVDVRPIVSLDPATWYTTRSQGGTDFGGRLTQLLGSKAVLTLEGSLHQDGDTMDAADGINFRDQLCDGGTPQEPCDVPREDPNTNEGGYGFITGDGESSRRQYGGSVTYFTGDHAIKVGGDYLDGRTDSVSRWTGGSSSRWQNEWGQLYYMHRFYSVSPTDATQLPSADARAQVLDYSLYAQDTWAVGPGLTVNAGLRWDGETTKNYRGAVVLRFDDQWQPRLGVAWDPWQDGKTKIYVSAGRFSYALPTAAVANGFGEFTVRLSYNFDKYGVVQDPNVFMHGETLPDPQFGAGPFGPRVDAGVRATYQDELTVGIERLLSPTLTVGLKGSYRRLGNALEERCDLDYNDPASGGSACAVINPGSNERFARGDVPTCDGIGDCGFVGIAPPPAKRVYRGIEVLARKTAGDRLWFQASYAYSSLRGNYDGGVNENVDGETTPGANRDFDYEALWQNAYGILALDRPHRFRLDGYWTTPWRLSVGLQAFAASGAPLNRFGFFNDAYGAAIFLESRGSAGRLPTFWGADLTLDYPILVGPVTVTLRAYVFNVFNKQIAASRDETWSLNASGNYPADLFDPDQPNSNDNYGKITSRQDPRLFRAAVKISF